MTRPVSCCWDRNAGDSQTVQYGVHFHFPGFAKRQDLIRSMRDRLRVSDWNHLAITFFLLLPLIASSAAQRKSADELYKEAVAADERGETQQAIALYQEVIALQPGSVQARSNLGVALAHTGRYSEAITQYQEALKRDPHNSVIRLNLALAQYKQGDFEKTATTLVVLRKEQPANKQSLYLLADCYLRLDRNSDTVALLSPAYQADPGDRAVEYALGTALIREGKIEQGEAVIDRILKDGNTAEANLLMGEAQFAARDYKAAAASLQKSTDLNSNLPGSWSLYGRALLQSNDEAGAKVAFQRAIQVDPNDFSANLHLGGMLRFGGNNTEAAPYLERALRLRPASPEARFQIGALDASVGKLDEARKILEQLEKEWPDFLEVHVQLATLYVRMGLKEKSQSERAIVMKLNQEARETGPRPDH